MIFRPFQILLIHFLLGFPLSGQTPDPNKSSPFDDPHLEQAPTKRLLDLGEIFDENPQVREKLNQRLERLAQEEQFSVFIVTYSGIIGSDTNAKAQAFRDKWLGSETEGIVVVCDTDLNSIAYSVTRVESLSIAGKNKIWKLADHEIVETMQSLTQNSDKNLSESEFLIVMSNRLINGLEKHLQAKGKTQRSPRFGYLLIFALATGLICALVWWSQKRQAKALLANYETNFPRIKMNPRLGALYGGGIVAEIQFERKSKASSL